mgnify:CR=1 FL=1
MESLVTSEDFLNTYRQKKSGEKALFAVLAILSFGAGPSGDDLKPTNKSRC